MLRFSNIPGSPPTLNNGKDDVPLNNYIIGSPNRPSLENISKRSILHRAAFIPKFVRIYGLRI